MNTWSIEKLLMTQTALFRDQVHGFTFFQNIDAPNRNPSILYLKYLDVKPDLPVKADWESQQIGPDKTPLTRLYSAGKKYFMEFSCQGKGVFVFEREKNLIEVYWDAGGTGFKHYLLTSGLAVALEFRGVSCLHGNTLAWKGKGFGLLGTSTAGKSTLSTALALNGCHIMSDDMLSLHLRANQWTVSSSVPSLRLWPDSLKVFFSPDVINSIQRVHDSYDKFSLDEDHLHNQWLKSDSRRLSVLYILDRIDSPDISPECWIENLSPADALISLIRESVLSNATGVLGIQESRLKSLGRLVSEIPVKRLCYTSGYDYLPQVCEQVTRDLDRMIVTH